jgi:hypothetical protein
MATTTTTTTTILQRFWTRWNQFWTNDRRWILLFLVTLGTYVYLIYGAIVGTQPSATPEQRETAYLLNPEAYGYQAERGNARSKTLFEWDTQEIILWTVVGLCTLLVVWKWWKSTWKSTLWYLVPLQILLVWAHTVILLFFLPVNSFHRRILYNTRSVLVQVCNDPLKELVLAFIFIVLIPLPGTQWISGGERLTWLALKLGLFYILQSILLGSPNYSIEPPDQARVVPVSAKNLEGYGVMGVMALAVYYLGRH